jgi:hypothetical protein
MGTKIAIVQKYAENHIHHAHALERALLQKIGHTFLNVVQNFDVLHPHIGTQISGAHI